MYLSTPFAELHGYSPRVEMFKIFGCDAFAHKRKKSRRDAKLSKRSIPGVMLGIGETRKGYLILTLKENKLITSMDVIFDELSFRNAKEITPAEKQSENTNEEDWKTNKKKRTEYETESDSGESSDELEDEAEEEEEPLSSDDESESEDSDEEIQEKEDSNPANEDAMTRGPYGYASGAHEDSEDSETTIEEAVKGKEVRRSSRLRKKKTSYCFSVSTLPREPKTFFEAVKSPQSAEWLEAMREELNALELNKTWTIVDTPSNKNITGSKWVFKVKTTADGESGKIQGQIGCSRIHSTVHA